MPGGGERHWIDPRFRERRPRSAGSRPGSAGQAPCPPETRRAAGPAGPSGAATGATARRRTLTPHERVIEERMARLRAAAESGAADCARESAARAGRGRGAAAGRQRVQGTGAVGGRGATAPCPPRSGAATPPAARVQRAAATGRATPSAAARTPTGAAARPPPAAAADPCVPRPPVGILRRSSSALGEVNAQLAAQAATSGQRTATRLTEAGAAGGARPKKQVRIVTPEEQACAERMSSLRARADEAVRTRDATAARSRPRGAGMSCPPSTSSAAAATPSQAQRVVLQPGDIDPTETTVITVPPPSTAAAAGPSQEPRVAASRPPCPCPRSATPPSSRGLSSVPPTAAPFDLDESCIPTGRTGNLGFLDQFTPARQRPATIAGFPVSPRRFSTSTSIGSDSQQSSFRGLSPFSSRPAREGGGACAQLPQTTVCPTTVRSVTARPISADPNVSVLQDDEFEGELLTDDDFLGLSEEDFHLGRSDQVTRPEPAVSPLCDPCQGIEVPRPAVADMYREIENRKEAWRTEQLKRNEEFLRTAPVRRQDDDPDRIYGRIMSNFYRRSDPAMAAAYEEQFCPPEVPVDEMLNFDDEPCPPEEFGPSARELFEAMREPDYGPYASELLSSNIQPLQPIQGYQPGPYASELMENVELCPTTGYTPGPYGSELMSNVLWEPPRMPDPYTEELLIDSLPCPPPPPSDPCDLADLLDW